MVQHLTNLGCLPDGTELKIKMGGEYTSISARGGQAALTELCQQLTWLGAALRSSPISSGICLVTPNIVASKESHSTNSTPTITVQLRFDFDTFTDNGLSIDADGTCWHAMFRNPVIVKGFPILARHEDDHGLELPLDMMSALAETQFATRYDTTLLLKGPCTMLIPTRRNKSSVTWHFISNQNGERIPYYAFRERCPSWIGIDKVSIEMLEHRNSRNFVGWASTITRHSGKSVSSHLG
jgi:hypothetical protein